VPVKVFWRVEHTDKVDRARFGFFIVYIDRIKSNPRIDQYRYRSLISALLQSCITQWLVSLKACSRPIADELSLLLLSRSRRSRFTTVSASFGSQALETSVLARSVRSQYQERPPILRLALHAMQRDVEGDIAKCCTGRREAEVAFYDCHSWAYAVADPACQRRLGFHKAPALRKRWALVHGRCTSFAHSPGPATGFTA